MVSNHDLCPCQWISAIMLSRREKMKTPFHGEKKEDELTKLLPKSVWSIHEEFEEIMRDICTGSPRGFETESNSSFSYGRCEHASTPYKV